MNAAFTKKLGGSSIMLFFLTAFLFGTSLSAQWTNYCVSVNATNNTDCAVTLYCDETADGQSIYNMGTLAPGQTKTIYPTYFGAHVYTISTTGGTDNGIYADNCGTVNYGINDGCSTSCNGQITGLQINPQNGGSMINLTDGAVFCESDFSNDIRLRALVSGSHESLKFTITGAVNSTKTENYVTYDSYQFWANPGVYYVNTQLYSQDNLGGTLCDEQNFSFTVEDCSAPPPPPAIECNLTASASSSATTICDGGSATISATASGANTCSDITNYYKINDTDPTCSGVYGQGVIFRRAGNCAGNHEPWTAGSDLYLTEYADGTALISGSIHNGNQTGTVYIELEGEANSGQYFNGSCYVNNLGNISHFYTGFWGTITVGGTEYSVEPKGNGADFILGGGAGNDGNGFGLGAWTAGTWGGCTEFFMNLTEEAIPAGNSGTTYAWTGPGGFTSSASSATVTESGTYSVTVTDCAGCIATDEVTISIQNATASVTASGGPLSCDVTSIVLTGGSTFANASYSWVGPNGFTSNQMNATVSAAGTYTVTAVEGGCSADATVIVMADTDVPTVTATGGMISCNVLTAQLTATGTGVSYAWTGPEGYTSTAQNPTVSLPGTYTVTTTGANGCTATATAVLTSDAGVPGIWATSGSFCQGSSFEITGSTDAANGTYAWTGPGGFTSDQLIVTVGQPGTYTLTVTGANGCSASIDAVVTLFTATTTASNNGPITCSNPTVQLSTNGANVVSYAWTGPNGYASTMQSPVVSVPGTYSITVQLNNGCSATATTTVESVMNMPTVTASNNGPVTCTNATAQLSATGTNIVSYVWTGPNGYSSTQASPGVVSAGTYTVTVSSADGCTATASTTVSANTTAPTVSAQGAETCSAAIVQLTGSSTTPGVSYSWTGPGGFISPAQNPFVSNSGTYTLTVTGPNGCTASTSVQAALEFLSSGINVVPGMTCTDDPMPFQAISAGAGATYVWDFGAGANPSGSTNLTQSVSWSTPGVKTITLTVTKGNCTETYQTTVDVMPCEIDLELTKTVDQMVVLEGEDVVWTITVINKGPSVATGVMVSDALPAGLTYLANTTSQGTFNPNSLLWNLGTLPVNGTATLTVTTSVDAQGTFVNTAQVASHIEMDIDSQPGNDDGDQSQDDEDNAMVSTLELAGLGDYVFLDLDEDGIQDAGEPGLEGIIVQLFDAANTTTPIATDTTDAAGLYQFLNLDPNSDYIVQFVQPATDYILTNQSGNASAGVPNDSDAGPGGFTDIIDLNPGEYDSTIDGGFIPKLSIDEFAELGNFAFVDLDKDGIQDAGEPGLEGVVVKLFDAADLNTPIAVDTTNANGFYLFQNLDPSDLYVVQFMMAPAGYELTTQSGNASDGIPNDSDAGANGFTDIIELIPGGADVTIDAGYVLQLATIGDYTWKDVNGNGIQDPGEAPLAGIIVSLFESMDLLNPISTVTTGTDGSYSFPNVDTNLDYVIQFTVPNALSGCVLTVQNSTLDNGDDTTDSDADPTTGYTDVIMVNPCDSISTIDAGFTPNFLGQIDVKALLGGATGAGAGGKPGTGGDALPSKSSLDNYGFIMHDNLREKGLIPTTEPYSAVGMGGNGETVDPAVLAVTGNDAIVDWVMLELRDANDMTSVVATKAALITRVGNVVDVDGVSLPSFDTAPGHYYVSIRHRNHMGAMTNGLVKIGAETAKVDFIDPTMACFGEGALEDIGGANVLHAGDLNHDGEIVFQGGSAPDTNVPFFDVVSNPDQNPNFNVNQVITAYCYGDFDMNGEVRYQGPENEPNYLFFKTLLHPDNVTAAPNYGIIEQLPENMD